MGGAYTSKPNATSTVDVPDGWNPDWPNPGPWPPGYTPTLTIDAIGPSTIAIGGTASVVSTLYDQAEYGTSDPDSSVTYTATLGGAQLGLKFSGDASYASLITKVFSDLGDSFFGNDVDIVFDTEEGDSGTIILTAASTVFGVSVSDTVSITIQTFNLSTTMSDGTPDIVYYNGDHGSGLLKLSLNALGAPGWSGDNLGPTTWAFKVGGVTRSSGTLEYNWPNGEDTNPAFFGTVEIDCDEGEGPTSLIVWETEGSFFGEQSETPGYNNQGFKAVGVTSHDDREFYDGQLVMVKGESVTPWAKLTWNYTSDDWILAENPSPYSETFFLLEDLGDLARGTVFDRSGECVLDSGIGDCSGSIAIYSKGGGDNYVLCETRTYEFTSGDATVRINKSGEYMPVWTENESGA
jgi:hypothetical protein